MFYNDGLGLLSSSANGGMVVPPFARPQLETARTSHGAEESAKGTPGRAATLMSSQGGLLGECRGAQVAAEGPLSHVVDHMALLGEGLAALRGRSIKGECWCFSRWLGRDVMKLHCWQWSSGQLGWGQCCQLWPSTEGEEMVKPALNKEREKTESPCTN